MVVDASAVGLSEGAAVGSLIGIIVRPTWAIGDNVGETLGLPVGVWVV